MIYDILENLEQYTGLFENLDTAIDWLVNNDIEALPLGRTEISGSDIYINVSELEARPSEGALFETHSDYMDIHIDLEGVELFEVALGALEEDTPYNAEKDVALYKADLSNASVLGPGRFLITMTEEPHKPNIASAQGTHLKKAVVKVRR